MKKKRGFTLVEALVVVILIALGAALAFTFYDKVVVEGRENAAVAYAIDSSRTISEAAGTFYLRTGTTPGSLQDLVDSGDLKAIPDPSLLVVQNLPPGLLAEAHASGAVFDLAYSAKYKTDGEPDAIDGYVDLTGIGSLTVCKKLNIETGQQVVDGRGVTVKGQAITGPIPTCPSGTYNESLGRCEEPASCTQGTYNSASGKCEYVESYAATSIDVTYNKILRTSTCSSGLNTSNTSLAVYGYVSSTPFSGSKPIYYVDPAWAAGTCQYNVSTTQVNGAWMLYGYVAAGKPAPDSPAINLNGAIPTAVRDGQTATSVYGYVSKTAATIASYTCPSGGTLSGSICITNPTAQSDPVCDTGTYDVAAKTCHFVPTSACPDGYDPDGTDCRLAGLSDGFDPDTDIILPAGPQCYDAGDGTYTFHYPFAVQ